MSCPVCTDEDSTKAPICDECWAAIAPLRNKLSELGYEVTKQEMTETWLSQMILADTLYDGDEDAAWQAAINIHIMKREKRECNESK